VVIFGKLNKKVIFVVLVVRGILGGTKNEKTIVPIRFKHTSSIHPTHSTLCFCTFLRRINMSRETKLDLIEYVRAYLGVGLLFLGYLKGWWIF